MKRREFLGFLSFLLMRSLEAYGGTGAFYWENLQTKKIYGNLNRVPSGAPGSIMKLVSAALLLEERILPATQIFECRGQITLNGVRHKCRIPHGKLDLLHALGHSCNVYFAQAVEAISLDLFLDYLKLFGLNRRHLKNKFGNVQELALGTSQALNLSALELLKLPSVIAEGQNGGFANGFSKQTWSFLQEGMKLAGRQGTGKHLDPSNKLHLALKTGTTEHGSKFQSWVIGFFPYEHPKYSFCARSFQGTSQEGAVPLARSELFARTWS